MRVCFVVDNIHPNAGWGRLAQEVAQGLKAQGHTVGFVTQTGKTADPVLKVKLREYHVFGFSLIPTILRMRRFLRFYDIVLCYDANPYGILVMVATLGLPIVKVVYALGTYSLFTQNPLRNRLISWVYNRADQVFVVSEFVKKQIEKSGYHLKNYSIVPVGVNIAHFQPSPHKITKGFSYIISVGALKHRKGYHLSIRAFAVVAEMFPDIHYVIVATSSGDAYEADIHALVEKLGLQKRVTFKEKVSDEDLVQLYEEATLFVLSPVTSDEAIEGFGMVYLEAGACGIPVIGTRDTGAEAAIVEGENGLLVDSNPQSIAQGIIRVLSDDALTRKLGLGGINRAQHFSWHNIVALHSRLFEKLLQK